MESNKDKNEKDKPSSRFLQLSDLQKNIVLRKLLHEMKREFKNKKPVSMGLIEHKRRKMRQVDLGPRSLMLELP